MQKLVFRAFITAICGVTFFVLASILFFSSFFSQLSCSVFLFSYARTPSERKRSEIALHQDCSAAVAGAGPALASPISLFIYFYSCIRLDPRGKIYDGRFSRLRRDEREKKEEEEARKSGTPGGRWGDERPEKGTGPKDDTPRNKST